MHPNKVSNSKQHRPRMARLEAQMKNHVDRQELITNHYFGHNTYARELIIPKGCTLTGKIHRFSCINIITKGDITVSTEQGLRRVTAPCVLVSPPGVKRAGYAHEDTIWICIHETQQTDPDLVEDEVIAKDFLELENSEAVRHPPAGLNAVEQRTLQSLLEKQSRGIGLDVLIGNEKPEPEPAPVKVNTEVRTTSLADELLKKLNRNA